MAEIRSFNATDDERQDEVPELGPPAGGGELEDDDDTMIVIPDEGATDPVVVIADPAPSPPTPPTPATDAPSDVPQWHRPSGASMDEGFYVWLSHHGVNPGDAAQKARLGEFKSNYLSLPETDHAEYRAVGRSNPTRYQFDLASWADAPDLPPPVPQPPAPPHDELPPVTVPPEPEPTPTPMPIPEPIIGQATIRTTAASAEPARYDWEGRRVGQRVWDERLGRYV